MNASSWRKAAELIAQGTQATQQIQPLTVSTPKAITTPAGEIQPTDTYRQIIPGMSECLCPTLTADGSLNTLASDDCSTHHKQITSELDKYLQEAAEKCKVEDNYFDG